MTVPATGVATAPARLRRSRQKGWRAPAGAVYVGRPGPFGNPFAPAVVPGWATASRAYAVADYEAWLRHPDMSWRNTSGGFPTAGESVAARDRLFAGLPGLVGRDLLCWCHADQPCHADVLLRMADPATAPASLGPWDEWPDPRLVDVLAGIVALRDPA